jgi:hypothetical protein
MPNAADTSMVTASTASTAQSSLAPPSWANRNDTGSPIPTNRCAPAHASARAAEHTRCNSSAAGSTPSNMCSSLSGAYDIELEVS